MTVSNASVVLCCSEDNQVLLLRRRPDDRAHPDPKGVGLWCLPGGKCEKETPYQAAYRELVEETGIKPDFLSRAFNNGPYSTSSRGKQLEIHVFSCVVNNKDVTLSDEHIEVKWFDWFDLPSPDLMVGPFTPLLLSSKRYEQIMKYGWPLKTTQRLLPDAPGQFGEVRLHDRHTGVDLYAEIGTDVISMANGMVVGIEAFTGEHVPGDDKSPWWNNTVAVLISDTMSNCIIVYGEIGVNDVQVNVGDRVVRGQVIGSLKTPVLRTFKGRPMVMLHLEVYSRLPDYYSGTYSNKGDISATVWWKNKEDRPKNLIDPTPILAPLATGRFDLSKYDGQFSVDPTAPRKESNWWSIWGGTP